MQDKIRTLQIWDEAIFYWTVLAPHVDPHTLTYSHMCTFIVSLELFWSWKRRSIGAENKQMVTKWDNRNGNWPDWCFYWCSLMLGASSNTYEPVKVWRCKIGMVHFLAAAESKSNFFSVPSVLTVKSNKARHSTTKTLHMLVNVHIFSKL